MGFPYATQQDMIDNFTNQELVELTNLADPSADTINVQVLDQALAEAASEIDAYLGARYDLNAVHAIDPTPDNLKRLNADIARYRMDNDCTREPVIERYKQAIKFLENLVKGITTLGIDDDIDSGQQGGSPAFTKVTPTFTKSTLSDFSTF